MTHKQRVISALERKDTDRTSLWSGNPKKETIKNLISFYRVKNRESLLKYIGDDIRWVMSWSWKHPEGKPIFEPYISVEGKRSYASPGIFADCTNIAEVEKYPWPDVKYLNCDSLKKTLESYKNYAVLSGSWAPFFHETADFFGMENYFIKMYTEPAVVESVTEHIVDFHLNANEKIFNTGKV